MTYYESEINRIRKICYSNNKQIEMVISVRKFIDDNFEKELNLNGLTRIQFMSKFHLLRLFKKYYGVTPGQYLTSKRIQQSKRNLKQGMTVAETCFSVGFGSPSSFSTLFKGKIGLSPVEFQKRATFAK
jgi:AraC-like DNA-binding protein